MTEKVIHSASRFRANLRLARELWPGQIDRRLTQSLKGLSDSYGLSLMNGELQILDGRWYVTHAGLIRLAERRGCSGIGVQPVRSFCDGTASRWVFKATVFKRRHSKGFVGYGDAD